jgi:hypothetical protein
MLGRNVDFQVLSYHEVLGTTWMILARNSALGPHALVLENGPELPKEPGPDAEEGGEVLHGVYAGSCATLEESRISRRGRAVETEAERKWSPFPTSSEDDEMTYDQARLIRRFRKDRRLGTVPR